jgi:hypothetical protein
MLYIERVLALFGRLMRPPRAYVTDISLAGMPTRAPSMLLDTMRVGPNTYMGVSRACDQAMAAPSSVSRPVSARRYFFFLAIEGMDEIVANKANQHCHFKTYRALHVDPHVSTGFVMGAAPMTIPLKRGSPAPTSLLSSA